MLDYTRSRCVCLLSLLQHHICTRAHTCTCKNNAQSQTINTRTNPNTQNTYSPRRSCFVHSRVLDRQDREHAFCAAGTHRPMFQQLTDTNDDHTKSHTNKTHTSHRRCFSLACASTGQRYTYLPNTRSRNKRSPITRRKTRNEMAGTSTIPEVKFVLMVNKQGQTRLAQYCELIVFSLYLALFVCFYHVLKSVLTVSNQGHTRLAQNCKISMLCSRCLFLVGCCFVVSCVSCSYKQGQTRLAQYFKLSMLRSIFVSIVGEQ
jgi:hypothetical protein